jgi:AcrR family transcriptional regulator
MDKDPGFRYNHPMNERSESKTPNPVHSRQQIIAASHRLFLEQGFHGTTMRQIAKESGMALGSLYTHFPGKDDLFKAVFDAYNPYLLLLMALENSQGANADELVRTAARRMVTALSARPDLIKLVFIDVVEFQGEHLRANYADVGPRLERFAMRIARDPAEVRNFSADSLLRAFFGLFYSFHTTELLLGRTPNPASLPSDLQDQIEIYLHGILR